MLPQVTFKGVLPTESVVDAVWRGARMLGEVEPRLAECHAVIELLAPGSRGRGAYRVAVHLSGNASDEAFGTQYATGDNVLGALSFALEATRRKLRAQRTATTTARVHSVALAKAS